MSCLFQSVEESVQIHQMLEVNRSTNCQSWQLNKKSHVSIQNSYFVVGKSYNEERVKNRSGSEMYYMICYI